MINSALLSAQNRQRLYWTNIGLEPAGLFGYPQSTIEQPKDKGILLKDVLESEVDEKYYLKKESFIFERIKNNHPFTPRIPNENQKSNCLKIGGLGVDDLIVHNTMPRSSKTGKGGTGPLSRTDGKTYCLDTGTTNAIERSNTIRRLKPIECERLQTVKDNYTNHVSDSQRYKMLGNGWTVDVIRHILNYMKI